MAEEYSVTIDGVVNDNTVERIQEKLDSHNFKLNASMSEKSIQDINNVLSGITIDIDANFGNIKDEIADTFVNIGGGLFEVNKGLQETVDLVKKANDEQSKSTRDENLKISNARASKIGGSGLFGSLGAAGKIAGAYGGGVAIGSGVDSNNQLEILRQRTGISGEVLGRFVSGLATSSESISPDKGIAIAEKISNSITDIITGKNPKGAEIINLLGMGGTKLSRENVLQALMESGKKDFGDKGPEINRLFEQISGVNFNAWKTGDFNRNLFLTTTELNSLNKAIVGIKSSFLELSNDIISDLLPVIKGISGFGAILVDAYNKIPFKEFGESVKESSETGFLKNFDIRNLFEGIGNMGDSYYEGVFNKGFERLDENGVSRSSPLGNRYATGILNSQLNALSTGPGEVGVGINALDIKKIESMVGKDFKINTPEERDPINLRNIESYLRTIAERPASKQVVIAGGSGSVKDV